MTPPHPVLRDRPHNVLPDAVAALTLIALCALLWWPSPLVHLDVGLRDLIDAHRPAWTNPMARALVYPGMPGLLGICGTMLALWMSAWHGTVRPLLPTAAVWLVSPPLRELQKLSDRVFPHWPDCPSRCPDVDATVDQAVFHTGHGLDAFPSGHSMSAVLWFATAVHLLPRLGRRASVALVAVPSLSVLIGQTWLGYHWLTDSLGGIAAGLLTARLLHRVPWDTVPLGPLRLIEDKIPARR